jgi:hypothetical protein
LTQRATVTETGFGRLGGVLVDVSIAEFDRRHVAWKHR